MFLIAAAVAGSVAILIGFAFDLLPIRLFARKFVVPLPSSSAVLVTGVSSGLGEAFAHDLAQKGFLVFGTVRKQADADRLTSKVTRTTVGTVHPILLDVADGDSIPAALEEIKGTLTARGRTLCAVVNNAGILGTGGLQGNEFAGPQHYERVFGTNVFGVVRVTEAFLPLLKAHGAGARIVNIGSYFGDFGVGRANIAQYISSKFAVEGLSDVWRRDLRRADIAVALVKPGDFSTNINPLVGASRDLSVVVNAVRDAITSPAPLTRYHAGKVVKVGNLPVSVLSRLLHFVPDRLADLVIP